MDTVSITVTSTVTSSVSITFAGISGGEKPPDALLDFFSRAAKAHAAGLDQAVRVLPSRARRIVEVEPDRGSRKAAAEQSRPAGEVGEVEQRVVATEADLLGEDRRVLRAGAASEHRSDIAEDGGAQPLGNLVEVLMGHG